MSFCRSGKKETRQGFKLENKRSKLDNLQTTKSDKFTMTVYKL